jgi:hypothetical protein
VLVVEDVVVRGEVVVWLKSLKSCCFWRVGEVGVVV